MGIKKRLISIFMAGTLLFSICATDAKVYAAENGTEIEATKIQTKAKKYTIKYMDGKKLVMKKTYKKDANPEIPKLSKAGYVFKGWRYNCSRGDVHFLNKNYTVKKDQTFYASWIPVGLIDPVKDIFLDDRTINVEMDEDDIKAGKKQAVSIRNCIIGGDGFADMVKWSSDNTDVVYFDKNGKCYAKKAGDATITATAKFDKSIKKSCKVHVTTDFVEENIPTYMELEDDAFYVTVGGYKVCKMNIDGDAYDIKIKIPDDDWGIAKVKAVGSQLIIKGVDNGVAYIDLKLYEHDCDNLIATKKIMVASGTGNDADYMENDHDHNINWHYDGEYHEDVSELDGCALFPGDSVKIKDITYQVITTTKTSGTVGVCEVISVGNVTIPSTVKINGNKYKVTSIYEYSFWDEMGYNIKKLTIGENVKYIGKDAFSDLINLKSLKIKSKSLDSKNVKKNAFKGINKKATIYVPKSKLKSYKKLFRKRGVANSVKFKPL